MNNDNTIIALADGLSGSTSYVPDKEDPMSDMQFSDEELQLVVQHVELISEWRTWERVSGENGRDLISIHPTASDAPVIRIAKSETGTYMAAGFGEWGLMMCSSLSELLDALAPGTAKVA